MTYAFPLIILLIVTVFIYITHITILKIKRRRYQGRDMRNQSEVYKFLSKHFIKDLPN